MTRTTCVLAAAVLCVQAAGCWDGSEVEIRRLQSELAARDEALMQLRTQFTQIQENLFVLSGRYNELGKQFDDFRGQNDVIMRQHEESVGKLGWTEDRLKEARTTIQRQADTLAKSPDGDARLAALTRTVKDVQKQIATLETRLRTVEAERDRLYTFCTQNRIDPKTGVQKPPATPTNPLENLGK